MATNFATRYKKDLSTDTLKAKLVRRKSVLQKESRFKEFNKGRQFGPIDVNTQASRGKELSRLEETGEEHSSKSKAKPDQGSNASTKTRGQERLELLQRYKVEKELRKLKEQREKPIFKCGRFKPEAPAFLPKASQIPVLSKPKETVAKTEAPTVRITRSMAKSQLQEPIRPQSSAKAPSKSCIPQISQQKQIYVDKLPKRENKEVPPVVSTTSSGRITRAAAAAAKTKIPHVSRPAPVAGNVAQKKEANKGKQQRGIKKEETKALHEMKENTLLDPVKEEVTPQSAEETALDEASSLEKENLSAAHIPTSAPPRRTRSFAPQNFVFKALEGLTTYKVKPMSPSKADTFLSPCLSWSPANNMSEAPKEDAKETGLKDPEPPQKLFTFPKVTADINQERQLTLKLPAVQTESVPEEMKEAASNERQTSPQPTDMGTVLTSRSTSEEQHNVPYFRNILRSETERLSSQCLEWDGTTEMDIPEDAKDLVRTTIGQTRLLIAERFKQFEGLVDNCEFQRGENETTCTDLDGFWDMVNLQIEDVNKKFENLSKLQGNGWQMVDDVQAKRPCKKKADPLRATKDSNAAAERAAARKRLAAIKAAIMKSKMKQEELAVSQETPREGEKVVFDGGFFQVESPAKPFSGWTPKSASRTSLRTSIPSIRTIPRSAAEDLLQRCADICVVRRGNPTTSKAVSPLPDQNVCVDPCGADLLGSISEQSDSQAVQEPCITAESIAEEASGAQLPIADKGSPPADQNSFVSTSWECLENLSVQKKVPAAVEEVEQSVANVNIQDILCSPKRDSLSENNLLQVEEPHTPECNLLGDLTCELSKDNGTPGCQPDLEDSLFFTPLRKKAEQLVTAATCDNLIVFSPVSLPEEGK